MLLRLFLGQGHVPHHDQAELTSLSRAEGGRSSGSTLCTAHPALAGCGRAQPPGWCWLGTCSCGTACMPGSWSGGDSTALQDMGQPSHLRPLISELPGDSSRPRALAGVPGCSEGWHGDDGAGNASVPCPQARGSSVGLALMWHCTAAGWFGDRPTCPGVSQGLGSKGRGEQGRKGPPHGFHPRRVQHHHLQHPGYRCPNHPPAPPSSFHHPLPLGNGCLDFLHGVDWTAPPWSGPSGSSWGIAAMGRKPTGAGEPPFAVSLLPADQVPPAAFAGFSRDAASPGRASSLKTPPGCPLCLCGVIPGFPDPLQAACSQHPAFTAALPAHSLHRAAAGSPQNFGDLIPSACRGWLDTAV